ncbi:aldo/keto reductase [Methylovirgula sp. 4M-Z18]|uniref:aldo/keto reductase n=1 Tax=Methylovirgula sp. 4M-Z18 TaxID=2293567 RepID=UPI000E2ED11B|nr:aldo/keto reductase [Methylovirgula sp. 4M-Z18]RFB78517.1 aldo/keto reductase [Methylovirgula sp. 4M-Z18]
MRNRVLGSSGIAVAEIGLGCMGMSEFYGPSDEAESLATLNRAHHLGVTFYDTAETYGSGHNESLVGRFLKEHRDVKIATKFGIVRTPGTYERRIDNSPDYIARACEGSLQRLGVETIDVYYAHRVNPAQPIEETVGAMARLVEQGKVRGLGLSEVSAATLRRAHAVHPISAVQTEYSLWTRDVEAEILPTCRELGIAFVPYSPLGRGMLTGAITSTDKLADSDFRRRSPRFQGDNFEANLRLVETVKKLAAAKGCTPGQIALAWLLAQGDDIIPIPGTRRIKYLEENVAAADVALSPNDLTDINAMLPAGAAAGARYPEAGMTGINA